MIVIGLLGFLSGFKTRSLFYKHFSPSPSTTSLSPIYTTAMHIPPDIIARRIPFRARIVKVVDTDNLRVRHDPPAPFWTLFFFNYAQSHTSPPSTSPTTSPTSHSGNTSHSGKKKLSESTIHVRLMGIDAPESRAFGMPSQPHSHAAKSFLKSLCPPGQLVRIRPLRIDQYHRLIATVHLYPPTPISPTTPSKMIHWKQHMLLDTFLIPEHLLLKLGLFKNASLEMVKHGWATLYTQSHAEYDGMESHLKKWEKWARMRRLGMWHAGEDGVVLPADHKKAYLQRGGTSGTTGTGTDKKSSC